MKFESGRFQRRAAAVAVGMLIASVAYGQSAEGSIYGRAKPGDKVTITSVENGATRQLTVDSNGAFNAAKLPPGNYRVTAGGVTRDVSVAIGSGTNVNFGDGVARVTVQGSRARNPIDVNSVESNMVFTAEQLQQLPVARDVNAVAVLAPGVVKGDPDLGAGGLPAFAGASVAENGYYINGFDVTNIRNFLSYANLPFDAIGAQQVKSGGYGAEFGRSLGGVISIVTKRGTNTWKGGGAIYWSPEDLKSSGKNVLNKNQGDEKYTVFNEFDKNEDLNFNVYAGGPIIKDKLFIFALAEGRRDTSSGFAQNSSTRTRSAKPNGMLKLDFTPNDMHRLEFTGITNKRKTDYWDYTNAQEYSSTHDGTPRTGHTESGGHTLIGKYTGYLTDNFTLSGQVGQTKHLLTKTYGDRVAALSCPTVYDVDVTHLGCWNEPFALSARDPAAPDDTDKRKAWRLDAELVRGTHTLRAGVDRQSFTSTEAGATFSGDVYWRYLRTANGTINGVANAAPPGTVYARKRISRSTSGAFGVDNDAYYIEDNWKITKDVLLYAGLRSESFDNMNGDGNSFIEAKNLLAPRLGFSWDVKGDATTKLYANAGRYYIPVASNTNIRATRGEFNSDEFFLFNGRDPVTAAPLNLSAPIGKALVNGNGELPHPATIADMNLKPMSQDEFILGFQQAIMQGWSFGVKGVYRKLQNGMDDYCSHSAFDKWAKDNGHNKFDTNTMAGCMMVNPGNDVTLMVDLQNDGKLVPVTFPASYIGLEKYKRTYNALEFTLDRPFDGKWALNASYTLSKSKGTAEGYVNSIINQEDSGVSQDFDFPSLTHGSNGYLSNDRRHVFKAFGTYMLNDTMRVGFNASLSSGRPISCIGFVPWDAPDYGDAAGYTTASSFYCLNDQGKSELHNRGTFGRTPWTSSVDVSFAWMPKWDKNRLTFQVDVFNLFNQQEVTEVNERRDYSRATTSENEGKLNMNWRQPTSFQTPRQVRLTARYEF